MMRTASALLPINSKGFTLTEMAVVLAIISILGIAFIGSYMAMKPTRNMNADGRTLLMSVQQAKLQALERGECVGVAITPGAAPPANLTNQPAINRGSYTVFVDDGAGAGGIACNAIRDGGEALIGTRFTVRQGVALTQAPVGATVADPNVRSLAPVDTDLFDAISFDARTLVATRIWNGAQRALVVRNEPDPALATWWGRVIVTPAGSVQYQTNNNPANQGNWSQ